jgi:four helix bundle protein
MSQTDSFRDLRVYQAARQGAFAIFELSQRFPREEQFSLTDQIRRSSRAVGAMLAEAWALRAYPAAFVDKLWRGLAEAKETQAWLDTALDCRYISEEEHQQLDRTWDGIGGMLFKMIEHHETFCTKPPRT